MARTEKVIMTNMCMVFSENRMLVQDKTDDDYSGITFPGGHVERGESFTDTYEVPGGHREAGENILEAAKRELQEETGAVKYEIKPICVYSVIGKTRVNNTGEETFGMLYFAEITEFAKELHSEMEKVVLMDELPENWTYPLI